jgi:hypothetical protein
MADEITINGSLSISATNFVESFLPGSITIDLASTAGAGGAQTIGTSHEQITKGDTTDGGVFFFRNLDATNYVEVGIQHSGSTFVAFLKLLPGEYAIGRLSSATIYAKANTAAVNLQYRILSP